MSQPEVPHHSHDGAPLPLSVMAQTVYARLAAVGVALILLWLAIAWAVALP